MEEARLLTAWMDLLNASLRSGQAAQQAWEQLAGQPELEKALRRWWQQTFPGTAPPPVGGAPDAALQTWVEEWQKAMGVVSRQRYRDLLEENDALRRRLQEAEDTIQKLRGRAAGDAPTGADALGDAWSRMMREGIKTQADWLKRWGAAAGGEDDAAAAADKDEGNAT